MFHINLFWYGYCVIMHLTVFNNPQDKSNDIPHNILIDETRKTHKNATELK